MSTIFILSENSFLSKNFYIYAKKKHNKIFLLNHNNIDEIKNATSNDIIINFCGVNRGNSYNDYYNGNVKFLNTVLDILKNKPFFVYISSIMINGFQDIKHENLSLNRQWFIKTKKICEETLFSKYPNNKLCMVRPSNIFGYNCLPYYNNILVSLIYDKICLKNNVTKINRNCTRNFLSVGKFSKCLFELVKDKTIGINNIISNKNFTLESALKAIYKTPPKFIEIYDGEKDVIRINNNDNNIENNILVNENFLEEMKILEKDMKTYLQLKNQVKVKKLNILSQSRGDMIEISSLNSKRLYKITITTNSIRGNHFHFKQFEEFFNNKGKVLYLLANKDNPNVIYIKKINENEKIIIPPMIIHTLINDYINNYPEIIISSTQEYIKNQIPDTEYLTII